MKNALMLFVISFFWETSFSQYTTLHHFANDSNGLEPVCTLISDSIFLYGTTRAGGINNGGTIFRIMPDGSGYSKLYDFDSSGTIPVGSLISDGTYFYGMTANGGVDDKGTIYKIKHDGSGFDTLKSFNATVSGFNPEASLVLDSLWLYGTTAKGGINDFGTVFKIMIDGSNYTKLLDFDSINTGSLPRSLIIVEPYLYGFTFYGGNSGNGVIFKIKKNGTGFTNLLDLDGINTGRNPSGELLYQAGFLYGMTRFGGSTGMGTLIKIDTSGNNYSMLLDFNGVSNGSVAYGSVISDGTYLYGMTPYGGTANDGTIFRILPDGSGYDKMYDFGGLADGASPHSSLYSDGEYFYGTTYGGGINNLGTVFRFKYDTFGIPESSEQNNIVVFPNPTEGELNLISPIDLNDACIEMYNMLGQQVFNKCNVDLQDGSPYMLNLSNLMQGSYILHTDGYKKIIIKQ